MSIYIGTSGYNYPYWKNRFYPEKLAASKWLGYYSSQFNTLELNSSFYRFPVVKNLQKAAAATPTDFLFTVKAHKIITHTRRMRDVKEKVKEFETIVMEGLQEKLACILFQLPPSYSYSEERLNDIVENLEHKSQNVIEFRHVSWWDEHVYDVLRKHRLTICSPSFPNLPETNIITSDIFYKRMHGVPELFISSYTDKQLKSLAKDMPNAPRSFVYFNNTMYEAGYSNAYSLKEILEHSKKRKAK